MTISTASEHPSSAAATPDARQFAAPQWRQWPFNLCSDSFVQQQRWWDDALHRLPGLDHHQRDLLAFGARQWLAMLSPANQLATNPLALQRTVEEGGANLWRGWLALGHAPAPEPAYLPGRDVALTPGKVVLQNRLIELIQYAPATATVHAQPILIVPAWIMKYYILDLSPHNSLIRHLVAQGHTVFCISWKNPGEQERDFGMDDYLALGFHAALGAVNAIVPDQKVHAAGYCLGGTLLAIAAAAMARDGDDRLASLSLLAAQTDFSEPGELGLFIDEAQLDQLDQLMAQRGYLSGAQMAAAFQMLRPSELLWAPLVSACLFGETAHANDLMAWNLDTTRMPARMHGQYLRRLFLHNDLSEGRYPVDARPVSLNDIRLPLFVVGTDSDHVAPWRSVYKLHHETVTEITFVLTSGGHNAGIVSEPGHPHRHYQVQQRAFGGPYIGPDAWVAGAEAFDGSWWPRWSAWLGAHAGDLVAPPAFGAAACPVLADAPGIYVMEK